MLKFTNTIIMKLSILIAIIIILILTINFQFNLSLKYNLFLNEGKFIVKLFYILPIFWGFFSIEDDFIKIRKNDKKFFNIKLKVSKRQMELIKELRKNIATKIYIKDISFYALVCLENPAIVSLSSAVLNILLNIIFLKIKEDNYDITINNEIDTGFRINDIKFDFATTISISIIDIVWAGIMTFINSRRVNNEKRRKTEC